MADLYALPKTVARLARETFDLPVCCEPDTGGGCWAVFWKVDDGEDALWFYIADEGVGVYELDPSGDEHVGPDMERGRLFDWYGIEEETTVVRPTPTDYITLAERVMDYYTIRH